MHTRVCCAMAGADIAYAASLTAVLRDGRYWHSRWYRAMFLRTCLAIYLCFRYEMSDTHTQYGSTRALGVLLYELLVYSRPFKVPLIFLLLRVRDVQY
eukprot:1818780-Rhodomonas_salina.3